MDTGEFLDRHFLPVSGAIQMDFLKGRRIKNMGVEGSTLALVVYRKFANLCHIGRDNFQTN